VREGLESFARGGVTPRYLILDDGWQSVEQMPSGEKRPDGVLRQRQVPGDLGPTVAMAKREFGIEQFLVWHALIGYWGGVDGNALAGYDVRPIARNASPGVRHHVPTLDSWWGPVIGVVGPEAVYRFFQDYHRHLRRQGVDGVKVDNQAALETVAQGWGVGRVALMQRYHEALEGSVHTHFGGTLINCMSCANEMLYGAPASNLTRTSTDFWPDRPESHGLHLYVNAQVSLWFGEWVHPDWDMFQSGHAAGAYHAAGRAVGGCPVYVSDKPDAHDFALLKKLVLPDGTILRADLPGRPTRDCLFHDPTREPVLLKIFNRNGDAGVVGAFNARYAADEGEEAAAAITGAVRPGDVAGLTGERFAVYAHHAGELRVLNRDEAWEIALPPLACEVFTVVPIVQGVAPIGLVERFNSAGAVTETSVDEHGTHAIVLRGGGRFVAWCERPPAQITVNDEPVPFTFDPDAGRLEVTVAPADAPPPRRLRLRFP
jgi:raffinose synthase